MKNPYQQVGKRIRLIRKQEGLTQAQLAEKVGLSDNYVGLIERGEGHPTLETLGRISDALKVGVGKFFAVGGTERKNKEQAVKEIDRFLAKRKDEDVQFLLAVCKAVGEYHPE